MAKMNNTRAQRAALRRLSERANAERNMHAALISLNSSHNSSSASSSSSSSSSSSAAAAGSWSGPGSGSNKAAAADAGEFIRLGQEVGDHLRACGVGLHRGLSEQELQRIEAVHGFTFPPDLRGMLSRWLPAGPGFPDWRSAPFSALHRWMGITAAWQSSGATCGPGLRAARYRGGGPVMIPVFGFFFLPAAPCRAGNPVFLIRDGAVVCCGGGLAEFFHRAFLRSGDKQGFDLDEAQQFPFEGIFEDGRRWSTSVIEVDQEEQQQQKDYEGWGRSLDALARCSSETLAQKRTTGRRNSFTVSDLQQQQQLQPQPEMISTSVPNLDKAVMRNLAAAVTNCKQQRPTAVRRIEFWSDAAGRQLKEHHRTGHNSPLFALSMCLSPAPPAASASHRAAFPLMSEVDQNAPAPAKSDPKWISSFLDDVAARLRDGGWREDDILEMVDSTSPKSVLYKNVCSLDDNSSKHEIKQQQQIKIKDCSYLFNLSSSLKKAGFSVEEVSDTLCFDLVNPPVKSREFISKAPLSTCINSC